MIGGILGTNMWPGVVRGFFLLTLRSALEGKEERKRRSRMEGSKLYVGNLSYSASSDQLKTLFSGYGEVREVRIIEGKGFGFVEMATQMEAEKARQELNGTQFQGRTITVDEARPQKDRQKRGGPRRY